MRNPVAVIRALILLSMCTACSDPSLQCEVIHRQELPGVPSASGTAVTRDHLYITGDNSPWLFRFSRNYQPVSRISVFRYTTLSKGEIIPKKDKPDFEAMEIIGDKLYLFGSGSQSPERDVMVQVDIGNGNRTKTYTLTRFYQTIRKKHLRKGAVLNIEGVAAKDNRIFFFLRGQNIILEYPVSALFDYFENGQEYPGPGIYKITLPAINGIQAGFSGATFVPGQDTMIFTASVEDTSNAYDDGKILGSFTGIIPCEKLKNGYTPLCTPLYENNGANEPLLLKAESVSVLEKLSGRNLKILLVTDDDTSGNSELLEALIHW
ncbi:hypothetical protein SAMN02927921_03386 [Sinomicrobium oceani]|uniref:DUF4397 domain-containing protein n=1 Tax=Sinomicrobium oceani TaxID=1150368 RepID=A0A1K1RCN0_9FLAO|nr:hypothetical protein [Sinomicrobium oceani]SFW69571.1 hypothetical protein SAMN02927921_03386 [Sinomicrobium oceani]